MNYAGGVSGGGWRHVVILLVTFAFFLVFAVPAVAQEDEAGETTQARQTDEQDTMRAATGGKDGASASSNDGCAVAQADDVVVEAGCDDENGGGNGGGNSDGNGDGGNGGGGDDQQQDADPLAGERVTVEFGGDEIPVRATVNVAGCKVDDGATITVEEDPDGERGTVTDGAGVEITATANQVVMKRIANEETFPEFDTLRPPVTVVSSTGITCDEDTGDGPGGGSQDMPPDDNGELTPEPQDEDKGPLAGGTAIGDDVLVVGDPGCGPTGENPCIDQITIETKDCELTGQGDDLTITLSDGGEPFRIRDGDNVDITLEQDGTIVADGRKTLGDTFPPGQRDNPTRRLVPIPVQGSSPGGSVNDTFPIASSTGIGGEGCQAVKAASDSNDPNGGNDVIDDTVPDKPLPKTGGPVILIPAAALLVAGIVGLFVARRRS